MPERKPRPQSRTPKRASFDYTLDFKAIDFRQHPELYRVGKGEQGVLLVEPYKGEILPALEVQDGRRGEEVVGQDLQPVPGVLEGRRLPRR